MQYGGLVGKLMEYLGSCRVDGLGVSLFMDMVVSLNYCSQNGGNLYRAPYYNGNPYIGPRTTGNLDQSPYRVGVIHSSLLG